MRKNIYPLSPVHAFPAAWSGSARKLKDTSGLHDVTGFWNGKSSQINPARGLQAGILPEKRHFSGVWKRNTNRHAENDFPLSAGRFSVLILTEDWKMGVPSFSCFICWDTVFYRSAWKMKPFFWKLLGEGMQRLRLCSFNTCWSEMPFHVSASRNMSGGSH